MFDNTKAIDEAINKYRNRMRNYNIRKNKDFIINYVSEKVKNEKNEKDEKGKKDKKDEI